MRSIKNFAAFFAVLVVLSVAPVMAQSVKLKNDVAKQYRNARIQKINPVAALDAAKAGSLITIETATKLYSSGSH